MLAELGFRYDNSIYPIPGRRYGWPGFPLDIHEMTLPNGATIIEVPLSTARIFGKSIPACGGGYLRHSPYWYTRWAMRRIGRARPAIVYMHPYEIDTDPAPDDFEAAIASADKSVRKFHRLQLRNRGTVKPKLLRLINGFRFALLREVIDSVLSDQSESV